MNRSLSQLRWRCRRGTRELDLMLTSFLETLYDQSGAEEKKRFRDLLTWEDDELLEVLLSGKEPARSGFSALIAAIRNHCPINDPNGQAR